MKITIEKDEKEIVFDTPFTLSGSYQDLQRLHDLLAHGIEQGGGDLFAYAWMPVADGETLTRAMEWCKVRGYIARKSKPDIHYWKNTLDFHDLPRKLSTNDRDAIDWAHFDPEADENPLLG